MEPTIILGGLVLAVAAMLLWPSIRNRRANARFQQSIRVYDEARRARILAGEDPRFIPTAEEELIATGHGRSVRNIERLPLPDPVQPPRPTPTSPPEPTVADPFLARLAEQAKSEQARRSGPEQGPRSRPVGASVPSTPQRVRPEIDPPATDPFLARFDEQAEAERHRSADPERAKPPRPAVAATPAMPKRADLDDDDTDGGSDEDRDDGYAAFVAKTWAEGGLSLHGIAVERGYSAAERHAVELVSLVEGREGRLYANVREDGARKTYRTEMHRWWRNGLPLHASAFEGVRLGFDPATVLAFEAPARSLDAAVSPAFDRFACDDRRWVVEHVGEDGVPAFTVVSKVLRRPDKFTARSHFRFGHREPFPHADVRAVYALPALAPVPLARFFKSSK